MQMMIESIIKFLVRWFEYEMNHLKKIKTVKL
jgi:hypothetical protein